MAIAEGEHTLGGYLGQGGDVEHRAPALVHLFHGKKGTIHHQTVGTKDDVGTLGELEGGNADHHGRGRRLGRKGRLAIFLHGLAQLEVLVGGTTILIDGRIVVVGGDIGRETRGIGTRPMTKGGASMGHIKGEADILGQHLVDTFDHILGRTCLVISPPLIEPATPEL